jgi:hypothetical protein
MIKKWWDRYVERRMSIQEGREFLKRPHDANDPECVKWWGDRAGMDWSARCPTCNPEPVHWLDPALPGAVHAFPDVSVSVRWDEDPSKVTCTICRAVMGARQ